MKTNLYQCFYASNQVTQLDEICIPFDNTKNENPNLREYPLFKQLYELEKNSGDYWGLLSFRFKEKTLLEPKKFKEWIEQNPGHDVYYIDPFLDVSVTYPNLWVQGEQWHPGLYAFFRRLAGPLASKVIYHPDDFATCNFFVGNKRFWDGYFNFVDEIIDLSGTDDIMKHYMFNHKVQYNGQEITYFSFIVERLLSLYFYYNRQLNKKKFPIEHDCFKQKYGSSHAQLVNIYKSRI